MSVPVRLAAYGVILAVLLTAGIGIGRLTDLGDVEPAAASHSGMSGMEEEAAGDGGSVSDEEFLPGAPQPSIEGYTLSLEQTSLEAGGQELVGRILGEDGEAVTQLAEPLALVVVSRDLTGIHKPDAVFDDGDGTWTAPLDLSSGAWRVYVDVTVPNESPVTLSADLLVGGDPEDGMDDMDGMDDGGSMNH